MNKISALLVITLFSATLLAQDPPPAPAANAPNKFAPAKPDNTPAPALIKMFANYDFVMVNPSSLNDTRANTLWGTTTATRGNFSGLNGFSVGGSLLVGPGYLGAEYAYAIQELDETLIIPTTTRAHDTFDYSSIYAVYDLAYVIDNQSSWDVGGGIGYALTYQFHNVFESNGTTEEVIWQANPILFKVRAGYSYHFSENVRARLGATYEYATSDQLTADSNHPTIGTGIITGQPLRNTSGSNQVVDMSGFRLSAGLVIAL
jgi:hypothetical protein